MTDFEIAIQRMTTWLRDFGPSKEKAFTGDLSIILLSAKDAPRLQEIIADKTKEVDRLRAALHSIRLNMETF